MTNEEIYEKYAAFVTGRIDDDRVQYAAPHCDSRILHAPSECEYCADQPELQGKRWLLGIAHTGHAPGRGEIPCEADATRPPDSESDHRRWGGNKPTSANGDDSWPEETFASKVMYGDHFTDTPVVTPADSRRVLDVLLSVLNGEPYPVNDVTKPHLEEIIEKIDAQLDTGWTGESYTVWMEGTGP
jgi:hypothetical protein